MNETFEQKVERLQQEQQNKVNELVKNMMNELDYSKHDLRNNKNFVEKVLRTHYNRNGKNSKITAAQWDKKFSIFSPYKGTY